MRETVPPANNVMKRAKALQEDSVVKNASSLAAKPTQSLSARLPPPGADAAASPAKTKKPWFVAKETYLTAAAEEKPCPAKATSTPSATLPNTSPPAKKNIPTIAVDIVEQAPPIVAKLATPTVAEVAANALMSPVVGTLCVHSPLLAKTGVKMDEINIEYLNHIPY